MSSVQRGELAFQNTFHHRSVKQKPCRRFKKRRTNSWKVGKCVDRVAQLATFKDTPERMI